MIDEVAGQLVALIAVPLAWKSFLAGFILFRASISSNRRPCDNWRRLPEGAGIVFDDVAAGLYALGVMHLLLHFGLLKIVASKVSRVFPHGILRPHSGQEKREWRTAHRVRVACAGAGREAKSALRARVCGPSNGSDRSVQFGEVEGGVVISAEAFLVARVPEGATSGPVVVATDGHVSNAHTVKVAVPIAENLHPVANPALDTQGNIYATFSGSRGQKVPVAIFKIDTNYTVKPFVAEMMNATGDRL